MRKAGINAEGLSQVLGDLPFLNPKLGTRLLNWLIRQQSKNILEIGTAHGVSTSYLAAAAAHTGGHVTTVDHCKAAWAPGPDEVLKRVNLREHVTLIQIEHSSYAWWLRGLLARDPSPRFDFCFLDGVHDFAVDAAAVILIERLLVPGGWLLMDDLGWLHHDRSPRCKGAGYPYSEDELSTPPLREVFEHFVAPNPVFSEVTVEDGWLGWAQKRI